MQGRIGLLRPGYSREELFYVFRILTGKPFTKTEQSLAEKGVAINSDSWGNSSPWTEARKKVVGPSDVFINPNRELPSYQFFLNCNADAFDTAADHLDDLLAKEKRLLPGHDGAIEEWVRAQDTVFKNCEKDAGTPAAPTPQMNASQRADRLYQVAATNFYAMHYDDAAAQFEAIASDSSSEWHDLGLFLAARCYLRKATVGSLIKAPQPGSKGQEATAPPPMDRESLQKALAILRKVVADPSLGRVHASALRLISFAELRLEPEKHATQLASSLRQPTDDAQFATNLNDYLHLLRDHAAPEDEMGQWIAAMQNPGPESIERWRKNPHSQLWLAAALLAADGKDQVTPDLISAALKIDPASPLFGSAQFHAARLRQERGDKKTLRKQIDELLVAHKAALDRSVLNGLLIMRSSLAISIEEFSRFAASSPVGTTDDLGETSPREQMTTEDARSSSEPAITPAAAAMINRMPLSAMVKLAGVQSAPFPLRREVALAAFARGVLLGKFAEADAAARLLAQQSHEDASDLSSYLAARDNQAKRFSAAFVMLHWPGVKPSLDVTTIRFEEMRNLDNFRQNWWGVPTGPEKQSDDPYEFLPTDNSAPAFLTAEERKNAEAEYVALKKVDKAAIWLPAEAIAWAESHREDSRVPEALHLAVSATRYSVNTEGATPYSKRAFMLLHKNYPKNPWTAKTKYYY